MLKSRTVEQTRRLMAVSMGEESADAVIVNTGGVVNVYTGEVLSGREIAVCEKWIAYLGRSVADRIGPDTRVIDAGGGIIIPGFIDGHTHIAWMITIDQFLRYAMAGGTTTIITETLEPFPVCGPDGVIDFLDAMRDQPVNIVATVASVISISHAARRFPIEDLERLLSRDDIVGLGESYWQAVLQDPDVYLPRLVETLKSGKLLEGHSAGAKDNKLAAYVAAGISSCHEPINVDQVLERLRMGLHVMIREGGIRRDLETISEVKDFGIDTRRLILSTDSVSPEDLMTSGYMEYVVQKAIDCGFKPVTAIQMATLNVAEHFRLDHLIGGIAPGRLADLVMIPKIETIEAKWVMCRGRLIAEGGKPVIDPRPHEFSPQSLNSVRVPRDFIPGDFAIDAGGRTGPVRIRHISMITDLVTGESETEWPVTDNRLEADVEKDMIKVTAIDRTHHPGKYFTGFIQGFGLRSGAFACTMSWDSSDIIVIGANDEDMALAVNRLRELTGGIVVMDGGEILSELALPIFGVMSDLSIETATARFKTIKRTVNGLGVALPDPILSLATLTGAAIPYLRICEEGFVNLKTGKTMGLYVE